MPINYYIARVQKIITLLSEKFGPVPVVKESPENRSHATRDAIYFSPSNIALGYFYGRTEYDELQPLVEVYINRGNAAITLEAAHEYAHILTNKNGDAESHGKEFRANYVMVLEYLESAGNLKRKARIKK